MATEYQRGYAKGYNTGSAPRRTLEKGVSEANRIVMEALAERAERAERGAGIGKCDQCTHWQRHHGTAHWGLCSLTEKTIWTIGWPWRGDPEQKIRTQENFGCIRFQERKP